MKKNVSVIIGLNYGDECKGAVTDYLAHKAGPNTAVVRFSGGANAGHTVQLPNGKKHVFHHFGSGSLTGVPTILSKFFVVNPILFFNEADELALKVEEPLHILVDPEAYVTTPYDVFLNQSLEKIRGNERHGSCGVGQGETLERVERGFPLQVKDLCSPDLQGKLAELKEQYFTPRFDEEGISDSEGILEDADERFLSDAIEFVESVVMIPIAEAMDLFNNLVFEGSQGLCLDQDSEDYPHVTRSNTGLKNISAILNSQEYALDIYYLTRSYLTRHGAGPLKNEWKQAWPLEPDATNHSNDHQGSLRYAPLDYDRIRRDVEKDLKHVDDFEYNITGVITCCNQSDQVNSIGNGINRIISSVADALNTKTVITSWGFTRNDMYVGNNKSIYSMLV